MSRFVFYDLQSGVSGDMLLSSLIALINNNSKVKQLLNKINLKDFNIKISNPLRNGIKTCHCDVKYNETHHVHRHLNDIKKIINTSEISKAAKLNSIKIFEKLAQAESYVHKTTPEKVHFHEVGAVDSIIDIVGTCVLLDYCGIKNIFFNAFYFGSGAVDIAHGKVSLPVPAVSFLSRGFQFNKTEINSEMVTPTGAAILTALGTQTDTVQGKHFKTVFSSGNKNISGTTGYLSAMIMDDNNLAMQISQHENFMIETNIDDDSSENTSFLMEDLFKNGALDVFITPVIMKKGRAGQKISVLTNLKNKENLIARIFNLSTTFGLRITSVQKMELQKSIIPFDSVWGQVSVKIYKDSSIIKYKYEFEDLKKISIKKKMPIPLLKKELDAEFVPFLQTFKPE